ncbi:MAG: hypothetical protein JWM10_711 [Myxococcaceae bacterium]|nr:hypothetical protein [Myxococcaceae bacterium]
MRATNAGVSAGTHKLFLPPRLQVVGLQEAPHGLAADRGDEFAADRLAGDQANAPPPESFRRCRADHRHDGRGPPLREAARCPRPRGLEERSLQAGGGVPAGDPPDRLDADDDGIGHRGGAITPVEQLEDAGVLEDTDGGVPPSHHLVQPRSLLRRESDSLRPRPRCLLRAHPPEKPPESASRKRLPATPSPGRGTRTGVDVRKGSDTLTS